MSLYSRVFLSIRSPSVLRVTPCDNLLSLSPLHNSLINIPFLIAQEELKKPQDQRERSLLEAQWMFEQFMVLLSEMRFLDEHTKQVWKEHEDEEETRVDAQGQRARKIYSYKQQKALALVVEKGLKVSSMGCIISVYG